MFFRSVFSRLLWPIVVLVGTLAFLDVQGQTYGPNDPDLGGNNTSIGANNWSNTNDVNISDNNRATVTTRGISRYLTATDFDFAIPATQIIDGIEVVVERSSTVPSAATAVAILDNWTTGLTKTISTGVRDRCLVIIASTENGDGATDITALTYGGQSMTQVGEYSVGTPGGFVNRVEVWILLNAGIAAASSTAIVPTISASSFVENTEIYTSAVFQYVDQYNPILDIQSSSLIGTTTPYQLGTAVNTYQRAMTVSAIACGNNTTPASTIGGTNTYTVDVGTEGTDIYFANPGFSTSGGCLQTSTLLKTSGGAGTIQPTFTFAGTPNRQVAVSFTLQYATGVDNSVRIIKGGTIMGNNYAKTGVAWPANDAYTTYGGPTDLWGTTWTPADINAANFGVALSGIVQGNALRVDNIRVTVYTSIILPIELAHFEGSASKEGVELEWQTHTEKNNDYFTLERSSDGINFDPFEEIDGAGNSNIPITYSTTDKEISFKITYYRLKQTDFDRAFTYSNTIAVNTSELVNELVIFPNPASSHIKVLNFSDNQVVIRIISQTGIKVFETKSGQDLNRIDVSAIPRGLYVVEIIRGTTRKSQRLRIDH